MKYSRSLFSTAQRARVFISGIQPTGSPHIGNYLGFIKSWLEIQKKFPNEKKLLFIADLHSITVQYPKPEELRRRIAESVASLLAAGVDPEQTILFQQSTVPEHTELAWIFAGMVNVSTLQAKAQYLDKATSLSARHGPRMALLAYPLLQAADVLIHRGTDVPVGYDQAPHLNLASDLAERFNSLFQCDHFAVPKVYSSAVPNVRSLREPTKKMSKSDRSAASRIELTDSAEEIHSKLRVAFTDSNAHLVPLNYDPTKRPGISNLILLHSYFSQITPEEVVRSCSAMSIQAFKAHLAETIDQGIAPIREAYEQHLRDEHRLEEVLQAGGRRAAEMAREHLRDIKQIIGFS